MKVNVTKYKVKLYQSGNVEFILNSPEHEENERRDAGEWAKREGWTPSPTSVIVLKKDLPYIYDCMRGTSQLSVHYQDDISYLLKIANDGFKYIHLKSNYNGGGTFTEDYFYFPNWLVADRIERLFSQPPEDFDQEFAFELSPEQIRAFAEQVAPKTAWFYNDHTTTKWDGAKYIVNTEASIKASLDKWSEQYPYLKNQLESLERIAANYSDGDTVVIHVWFDMLPRGGPDSYFFDIKKGKDSIMRGGIIAHHHKDDDTYEYAMHT